MLPFLTDCKEALEFFRKTINLNDPQLAYIIAFLSREGWTNRDIRHELGIAKVYTLTHYKRVGLALSDQEFSLWDKNPDRITLGHLRVLCHLKPAAREPILRQLLAHKSSVAKLQARVAGQAQHLDADIKRYEGRMEDSLGRGVKIQFDAKRQNGKLILDFYGIDDLDVLANTLGLKPELD
ncbi:MAG TPA: transcriptional regulator [Cellvibrio sp.]|nr:transcriptional regulator [Cellvibrio sp.]